MADTAPLILCYHTITTPLIICFSFQVSDKYYHCGHCNNLQVISDMDVHLQACYPLKNRNVTDNTKTITAIKNNDNNKPTLLNETRAMTPIEHDKNTNNDKRIPTPTPVNFVSTVANKSNENIVNDKLNNQNYDTASPMQEIYGNVALPLFGCSLSVCIISYNVLCKRINDFYCGLCDFICPEKDIISHIHEIRHLELLQRTPFIMQFSFHLIRDVSIFVTFF